MEEVELKYEDRFCIALFSFFSVILGSELGSVFKIFPDLT